MKARVKKTGEIVEVYHETQHGQVPNIYKESVFVNGRMFEESELEFDNIYFIKNDDNLHFSITHDEMLGLYDRKYKELMKLSKEELVEKLIGKRTEVGMSYC